MPCCHWQIRLQSTMPYVVRDSESPEREQRANRATTFSRAARHQTYAKYTNVFRLVAPAGRQYLFQAHTAEELNSWLHAINYAAAFKSANLRVRPLGPTKRILDPTTAARNEPEEFIPSGQQMRPGSRPPSPPLQAWESRSGPTSPDPLGEYRGDRDSVLESAQLLQDDCTTPLAETTTDATPRPVPAFLSSTPRPEGDFLSPSVPSRMDQLRVSVVWAHAPRKGRPAHEKRVPPKTRWKING